MLAEQKVVLVPSPTAMVWFWTTLPIVSGVMPMPVVAVLSTVTGQPKAFVRSWAKTLFASEIGTPPCSFAEGVAGDHLGERQSGVADDRRPVLSALKAFDCQ